MESLYLGVAREIITPAIGGQLYGYRPDVFSNALADDLTVTAFYFRQGTNQALMLSVTVCLIQTELAQRILTSIEECCGIPKENCMLCATHTHSGPNTAGTTGWGDIDEAYCETLFIPAILTSVKNAAGNIQPVKMGTACGNSLVGINRRELDGNNQVILGQNPWGCFDPRMTVISFINSSGQPVANMIHYGAHGTAAGTNHEISRDWSGIMTDALEKQTGAITAFFNGPEGDVGPRITNGKTMGDLSYVRELGSVAAQDAVKIYRNIRSYTCPRLAVSHKTVSIPLKKRIPLAQAQQMQEEYRGKTVNSAGMLQAYSQQVIASYQQGFTDAEAFETEQTVIALGDTIFAAFPFELFSEVGMRIQGAFRSRSVLSLSNTNGSEGYFITQDAICRGGYEVTMFLYGHLQPYEDHVDFHLMRETVSHIQTITENRED